MMNYIDILLTLLILLNIYIGWQKGFIVGAFDLMRWTISLLLSFRFYQYLAEASQSFFVEEENWIYPFTFLFSFFIGNSILYFIEYLVLQRLPSKLHTQKWNKVLGTAPGLVNGVVLAAVAAISILSFPVVEGLRVQIRSSQLVNELAIPAEKVENAISPIFDQSAGRTLNNVTVDPKSEKFIKLPYTVTNPVPAPELESRLLKLMNKERKIAGLEPLSADAELQVVARKHSIDMFKRGYFSHYTPEGKDPFDRMKKEGVTFRTAGENLALAPTLSLAHTGLMESPGHRANILQPKFKRVGIGIMDGGNRGLIVTQNFRN